MMPSVLCLNDQGDLRMDLYEDISGTLRSQMDRHPPLVLDEAGQDLEQSALCLNDQGGSQMYCSEDVCGTLRAQEHGHQPLVMEPESYCIAGNIIDREAHNGGNGFGYQPDISYTLNTADRHAVFTQQRSDEYAENDVVCTQAARQYKDATDLICEVAGLDFRNGDENGDLCGTLQSKTTGGYSLNNIHPVRTGSLIRRLTPMECERLQGFPDSWTDVANGSDSARYKALGNSVAIPCVEFVMRGIACFL